MREYIQAGVAAIHLEDQTFPKRCGLLAGKAVVGKVEFVDTLKRAMDARRGESLEIIARNLALQLVPIIRPLAAFLELAAVQIGLLVTDLLKGKPEEVFGTLDGIADTVECFGITA